MRHTKIVCTIGPASQAPSTLEAMVRAGMDVARLNLSHGSHAQHAQVITRIRAISKKLKRPVGILLDLQGPRIRVGDLRAEAVRLKRGGRITLTTRPVKGTASRIPITYRNLARDVKPGDRILLDDGAIRLRVLSAAGTEVTCRVMEGGTLRPHKGVNLPGVDLHLPALTPKDRKDLAFGLAQGVDYVALSFVRRAEDVRALRRLLRRVGAAEMPIIAKLEKPEAVTHLEEILAAADGIMVARGDLGVEISLERVPSVQKHLIARANALRVPAITATQMLESMVTRPVPTRAEVSDVANALFDGTDAVMLSAETSVGKYPVEAVRMMARIIADAEASPLYPYRRILHDPEADLTFPVAISRAAVGTAHEIRAKAIVAFTHTGRTARLASLARPRMPILAFTPHPATCRRMSLYWGVYPFLMPLMQQTDALIQEVERRLKAHRLAKRGDELVVLLGVPATRSGATNLMKLHRIA